MADISKLEQQANLLMQNVQGWEQSVLERIGKRINRIGHMNSVDAAALNNLAFVKGEMKDIFADLAKVMGKSVKEVEGIYSGLIEAQNKANKPLFDARGVAYSPLAQNKALQAMITRHSTNTMGTMLNLAKTSVLGFTDGAGNFVDLQRAYTDALDKAVMQVGTGATDFHTAMKDTIKELGGSGVKVNYEGSGITRRLDTAVRQSLLWGAKQASVEYNENLAKELGCDGYEIDYHANPRPSHEFMQGQMFAIGGAKTVDGVHYEGFEESGAEEALNDYGCLHFKVPVILGVSEPSISRSELERLKAKDAKEYEIDGVKGNGYFWSQKMRALETEVRKEKSIRDMAKASGDSVFARESSGRIRAFRAKYEQIAEITGISEEPKRMSVTK